MQDSRNRIRETAWVLEECEHSSGWIDLAILYVCSKHVATILSSSSYHSRNTVTRVVALLAD
jgi:hypothetical protein